MKHGVNSHGPLLMNQNNLSYHQIYHELFSDTNTPKRSRLSFTCDECSGRQDMRIIQMLKRSSFCLHLYFPAVSSHGLTWTFSANIYQGTGRKISGKMPGLQCMCTRKKYSLRVSCGCLPISNLCILHCYFQYKIISNLCMLFSAPVGNGALGLAGASCLKLLVQLSDEEPGPGWLKLPPKLTAVTWKYIKGFQCGWVSRLVIMNVIFYWLIFFHFGAILRSLLCKTGSLKRREEK